MAMLGVSAVDEGYTAIYLARVDGERRRKRGILNPSERVQQTEGKRVLAVVWAVVDREA